MEVNYLKELEVSNRNAYFKILLREAKRALESYLAANKGLMYKEVAVQKVEGTKMAIEQVRAPSVFPFDKDEDDEPFTLNAIFSSQDCKEKAASHQEKCFVAATLYSSGASIKCVILTQKGFNYFWQRREALKNLMIPKLSYLYSDYARVYNFCTNKDLHLKDAILMAIFLLRLLKLTAFFGHEIEDKVLTDEECYIGSLILRHLQLLQFNAHEFFELRNCMTTGPNHLNYRAVHVGGALYSTLALFNHSIIRYFKGNKIIVRAIKYIKKDEIIYENYGPIYCSKNPRFKLRDHYKFTCLYMPHQEDLPIFNQMQQTYMRVRCRICGALNLVSYDVVKPSFKCTQCGSRL